MSRYPVGRSARAPLSGVVDPQLRAEFERELDEGEKIVWIDQPLVGRMSCSAWPIAIFGVVFTGFSIFWMIGAGLIGMFVNQSGDADFAARFFPLCGLPFLLVGLGMLTAPIWARRAARRTIYAITDRRAIVWNGRGPGAVRVESFAPSRLTGLTRIQHRDGSGDLIFDEFATGHGRQRSITRRGFVALADVRRVEKLINEHLLSQLPRDSQTTRLDDLAEQ